ncbi:MAG: DUF1761 domain-containing protein [Deltaproteobacteria bacterium]|nr:DUF1761 domain-containing protein [Deltaproteobacteria bacterium]MBN2674810.1 DUF1761 domain-containing protein [Deltaproteobacteria bacterium]
METLEVNYIAIIVGAVASMVVGAVWYGPLFGRIWMNIVGVNPEDEERRKEMQKGAGPLYLIQFLLTLFQVLVLAHLIADTQRVGGIERALWIWGAFVVPSLAGAAMWTMDATKIKWARFLIQGGYQLVMFAIYGALLQFWT